jgi:DNA repair protein RecN (Recombination protein N)
MAGARFAAQILWTAASAGAVVGPAEAAAAGETPGRYAFEPHGLDTVAFLISANPGEPLRPLAKVASGGETSRLMLALKTVLGRADETPTLIFDEIDQGIGGRVGGTVGRKLWGLTRTRESGPDAGADHGSRITRHAISPANDFASTGRGHQVLCITHLPQLAAYGEVHFHVAKHVVGERTVTEVRRLTGEPRVTELARMLGADSDAGRASVAEMMAEVGAAKERD